MAYDPLYDPNFVPILIKAKKKKKKKMTFNTNFVNSTRVVVKTFFFSLPLGLSESRQTFIMRNIGIKTNCIHRT